MTGQKKPIRNSEDFQRAMQIMYREHGILADPEVRRSAMGTTIAFSLARPQQLEPPDMAPHLEGSESNLKNPGKAGE